MTTDFKIQAMRQHVLAASNVKGRQQQLDRDIGTSCNLLLVILSNPLRQRAMRKLKFHEQKLLKKVLATSESPRGQRRLGCSVMTF